MSSCVLHDIAWWSFLVNPCWKRQTEHFYQTWSSAGSCQQDLPELLDLIKPSWQWLGKPGLQFYMYLEREMNCFWLYIFFWLFELIWGTEKVEIWWHTQKVSRCEPVITENKHCECFPITYKPSASEKKVSPHTTALLTHLKRHRERENVNAENEATTGGKNLKQFSWNCSYFCTWAYLWELSNYFRSNIHFVIV